MNSLFSAEDLKSCPLHFKDKFSHYANEWQEFERQNLSPTQTEIYLFRQKLSERAAGSETSRLWIFMECRSGFTLQMKASVGLGKTKLTLKGA